MLRWNLRERALVQPFVEIAGGVVATNQELPENTTRVNFSSHAGGGRACAWQNAGACSIRYRFQHLSNGSRATRNPGINSNVGSWPSRKQTMKGERGTGSHDPFD